MGRQSEVEVLEKIYAKLIEGIITTLTNGDIQIGAVEIKNATTDDRAEVQAGNTAAAADMALTVADPNVKSDTAAMKTALEIIDDWDNNDAAKTVSFTTIIKKTGAQVGADGAAYIAGDVLGDQSPIALAAGRYSGGAGTIHSITVKDLSKQNAALKIVFFDANPSNTTFTDNQPLDLSDSDIDKVIAWVDVAAGDYISFSDNSVAHIKGLNIPMLTVGSANLYFCIIVNSSVTYVADELSIAFGVYQD